MKRPLVRCPWVSDDPIYIAYHDDEWGVPLHDDRRLFEMVTLEGAQAGLSWLTILKKREGYRRAFAGFDFHRVAAFGPAEIAVLIDDAGIVRHRQKIESTVGNAQALLRLLEEVDSFDSFLWGFVGGEPLRHRRASGAAVPASSPESDAMSRDLKKRGFRFVGTTICYAFMQACGLVDDHSRECFRASKIRSPPARRSRS